MEWGAKGNSNMPSLASMYGDKVGRVVKCKIEFVLARTKKALLGLPCLCQRCMACFAWHTQTMGKPFLLPKGHPLFGLHYPATSGGRNSCLIYLIPMPMTIIITAGTVPPSSYSNRTRVCQPFLCTSWTCVPLFRTEKRYTPGVCHSFLGKGIYVSLLTNPAGQGVLWQCCDAVRHGQPTGCYRTERDAERTRRRNRRIVEDAIPDVVMHPQSAIGAFRSARAFVLAIVVFISWASSSTLPGVPCALRLHHARSCCPLVPKYGSRATRECRVHNLLHLVPGAAAVSSSSASSSAQDILQRDGTARLGFLPGKRS